MIDVARHDDVTRLACSSAHGRLLGMSVSAYLVRGVLVDSAFPRARDELRPFLRGKGLLGAIITHAHEDHAGNVPLLAELGVPIWMAPATAAAIARPPSLPFYRRWTWGNPSPLESPFPVFEPEGLGVIHTPGHAADHHVVWDPGTRTLFSADLFLGFRVRTANVAEDQRATIRSLRQAIALEPRRMFDAHRGLVADPVGALRVKADWMEQIVTEIERRVRAGHDDGAILREVMRGEALVARFSGGEYSRRNFVRSVRARMAAP